MVGGKPTWEATKRTAISPGALLCCVSRCYSLLMLHCFALLRLALLSWVYTLLCYAWRCFCRAWICLPL